MNNRKQHVNVLEKLGRGFFDETYMPENERCISGNITDDVMGKGKTGSGKSTLVGIKMSDTLKVTASTIGGGAAGTAGSLTAVSAMGSVGGLSAAGMTSGLSAIGSLVGGGMVAGLGVASAPVLALGALGVALTSDNIETDEKIVAGAGAGVGIAGSVATVSAAGAVGGLSAAGVTSGLAAVGGLVGGGMITGIAVTCAGPLAVAGLAYGMYRWLKD
jgi:hypothetical protein